MVCTNLNRPMVQWSSDIEWIVNYTCGLVEHHLEAVELSDSRKSNVRFPAPAKTNAGKKRRSAGKTRTRDTVSTHQADQKH